MESTKELNGLGSWLKKLQSQYKTRQEQKTYIIPTKFGLAYGLLCFALLMMAMAYGNNLVYVVCFYLTVMGMGLARIINNNVNSVHIESCTALEIFAGTAQKINIHVRNTSKSSVHILALRIGKKSEPVLFDMLPEESKVVEILWTAPHRGYVKLPALQLSSEYPSGLFHAWKVRKKRDEILVYPELKGQIHLPETSFAQNESIGVLREIRDYKPGDSPKRIHWRSLAKNGQLRTMVHESNEGRTNHFTWDQVQHLKLEDRLSQIALWLQKSHDSGNPWTLKLPHQEFNSNFGTQAYHAALKELALWKETR